MTAALTEAVLSAARESALETLQVRRAEPAAPPRARRARRHRVPSERTRARVSLPREETDSSPPMEAPSDLVITDPQALLAALETSEPAATADEPRAARGEPQILRSVEAVSVPALVPALRAGEEIMRTSSASGVVLRRRRV